MFLIISFSSINAQILVNSGKVIGSINIGDKEFSSILDETRNCILRTSIHESNKYRVNEIVKIKTQLNSNKGEIIQLVSKTNEKVYVDFTDCDNKSIYEKEKKYEAPISPFPKCNEDKNPIGGGLGYKSSISISSNIIIINSQLNIIDFAYTIENAPIGSTISIYGNLTFNLTNLYAQTGLESITIPEGVTLFSNRGISSGALIYTDDFSYNEASNQIKGKPLFIIGGKNVRISGIRFKGPTQEQGVNDPKGLIKIKSCFEVANWNDSFEADNCAFYGWPYAAISIGIKGYSGGSFKNNKIHHCYFYNNRQKGLGYGVVVYYGYASIYSNTFENNRHDIAGGGEKGSGYEASCNTVREGGTGHNFDMHAEGKNDGSPNAGRFIYIHHNDFLDLGYSRYHNDNSHNIFIRGRPDVQCRIENNRFAHDGPQASIKQHNNHKGYGNMLVWNNIYDSDDYLGWYVKEQWLKTNTNNFVNLPSSNDLIMTTTFPFFPVESDYKYDYTFGDYDGDGNTDVFKLENSQLYRLPLDADNYGLNADWEHILTTTEPISSLRFDFFNNDNKTDIIYHELNTIYISIGSNSNWVPINTTTYNLSELKLGDFDGNGVTDLFLADGNQWYTSYNSVGNWQAINNSGYTDSDLLIGRFNNNNISDVFLADGSDFMVSFGGASNWYYTIPSGYSTQDLIAVDFNGDNISDIIEPNTRIVSLSGNTSWINCKTGSFPISSFTYGDF